jgi:hypothetical protein
MWEREDSQEVGSEAAILKRVRNSSLVEWSCADNVTGLKSIAEAADFHSARVRCRKVSIHARESRDGSGRGASILLRSGGGNRRGAWSSENVGMSSERGVRNPSAVSPRVPGEG